MQKALLLSTLLLGSILAGCASNAPGTTLDLEAFSVMRVLEFRLDNENIVKLEDGTAGPYDFVTSTLVVRVGAAPAAASALSVAYTDRDGKDVTRPLSDFTDLEQVPAGGEVRIEDANITSGATVYLDGAAVAARARPPVDWWKVNGYPTGVVMEPGSTLTYAVSSDFKETFGLRDLDWSEGNLSVDSARASLGLSWQGTLELAHAAQAQDVQAESSHRAHPLSWRTQGHLGLPLSFEARGTHAETGDAVDAGIRTLDESGVTYDASGKIWWNDTLEPVRLDIEGGSWASQIDAIAWLTGVPELEGSFSCAGKTREEACRPSEIPFDKLRDEGEITPRRENVDGMPYTIDEALLANLTRLMAEDLRPGDELRFEVDIRGGAFPAHIDFPDEVDVRTEAVLRAVGYEQVSVGAGTFEALKVVERVVVRFDIAKADTPQGEFGPYTLDQTVAETDFWLQKGTFVPLRIEQRMPFDVQAVVRDLVEAVPEAAWAESGVEGVLAENIDFAIEARMSLELTEMTGESHFSPWALFMGFHSLGFAAAAPFAHAYATPWGTPAEPVYEPYDRTWPGEYQEPTYQEPDYTKPTGSERAPAISLGSASAIVDGTKTYTVTSANDVWWYGVAFTLDGEYLAYDGYSDGGSSWCVVVDGACGAYPYDMVEAGDTLRIRGAGLEGKTLRVLDMETNSVLLTLVVS